MTSPRTIAAAILVCCTVSTSVSAGGRDESSLVPVFDARAPVAELAKQLANGSPAVKEGVLNWFEKYQRAELIPAVIEATLDDAVSVSHGDSGWAATYHHAATLLCSYARKRGERTEKDCRSDAYTFVSSAGTASAAQRQRVHDNWLAWFKTSKVGGVRK